MVWYAIVCIEDNHIEFCPSKRMVSIAINNYLREHPNRTFEVIRLSDEAYNLIYISKKLGEFWKVYNSGRRGLAGL